MGVFDLKECIVFVIGKLNELVSKLNNVMEWSVDMEKVICEYFEKYGVSVGCLNIVLYCCVCEGFVRYLDGFL